VPELRLGWVFVAWLNPEAVVGWKVLEVVPRDPLPVPVVGVRLRPDLVMVFLRVS
jgi:hypothetical protein